MIHSCSTTVQRRAWRKPVPAALLSLGLLGSLGAGLCRSAAADAVSDKSDQFLTRKMAARPAAGWTSVIVKLHGDLSREREGELKALGGYIYRRLPLVRSVALRVPNKSVGRLAALPFVARLSSDVPVRKNDEFTARSSGADAAFEQYHLTGSGIGVAVVDSGVRSHHPDVSPNLLRRVNFVSGSAGAEDPCGHGTHVAGIIAGNGAASTGSRYHRTFYGVARRAGIVSVRVLDGKGRSDVSTVLAGIQWVVNNRARYNIRVLNLSLGHPVGESYATDPLCLAVEKAWKAGIVVVCAAGNGGRLQDTPDPGLGNEGYGTAYGSIHSPGNSPFAITVGAMKQDAGDPANRRADKIATYSSRGPTRLDFVLKPDLVAPGNRVIAALSNNSYLDRTFSLTNQVPRSYYCNRPNDAASNRYFRLSGTSMAAPVVAGAAALMLQADPGLSPDTVKARLMLSADKLRLPDGNADPCTFGAGYLNIPAALGCAAVTTQPAVSPSLHRDGQGVVSIDAAIWSEGTIWGTGIRDLSAIWSESAVWSESALSSSSAIWSEAVWKDAAIWSERSGTADLSARAIFGED